MMLATLDVPRGDEHGRGMFHILARVGRLQYFYAAPPPNRGPLRRLRKTRRGRRRRDAHGVAQRSDVPGRNVPSQPGGFKRVGRHSEYAI